MKIIAGQNCTGKTKELIQYSLENDTPILVFSPTKAESLIEKSKVYFGQVVQVVYYKDAAEYEGAVLIDDLDEVLTQMLQLAFPNLSVEGFVVNV